MSVKCIIKASVSWYTFEYNEILITIFSGTEVIILPKHAQVKIAVCYSKTLPICLNNSILSCKVQKRQNCPCA
jgi:hypothetical protein